MTDIKLDYVRLIECILIFLGLPLLVYTEIIPLPNSIFLFLVTAVVLWLLKKDDTYSMRSMFAGPIPFRGKEALMIKTLAAAAVIFGITWFFNRENLFLFPRERPGFWLLVMIVYPVLFVLPQELIYREFFFHRYKNLFSTTTAMILASTLAFSFLHIIYDNGWAVGLTLAGGFLFCKTYTQTKSLLWVSMEHTIYGWLIFTIGMGNYFYESFF